MTSCSSLPARRAVTLLLDLALSAFVVAVRAGTEGADATCLAQFTCAGRCGAFSSVLLERVPPIARRRAAERPLLGGPLRWRPAERAILVVGGPYAGRGNANRDGARGSASRRSTSS